MLNFSKTLAPALLGAALAFAAPAAAKDLVKSGTISINETLFGFLVGGSTGGGTLTYKGKSYPFRVGGLSVGNIGVARTRATGTVYNMTKLSQFNGTYSRLDASATAVQGAGALRLRNGNGVVIHLSTTSGGLQLNAGAGGVEITLR